MFFWLENDKLTGNASDSSRKTSKYLDFALFPLISLIKSQKTINFLIINIENSSKKHD